MSGLPLLLARRYFHGRRQGAGNAATTFSILGIAVGVMTLTVILAVMNGFQLGFIESIVEVSSYHLQLTPPRGAAAAVPPADVARMRSTRGVTAVVPFVERQALIESVLQRPRACVVRAVPPDLLALDPVQARMLAPVSGQFDLRAGAARASADAPGPGVFMGAELAAVLGVRAGEPVVLVSYGTGPGGHPVARRDSFVLTGTFRTGYYDFDSGLAFISLEAADALYGGGEALPRTWGVKLANRFSDAGPLAAISAAVAGTGYTAESWRTYNRSFFDALAVEKLMMMLLVGLIFLVVGFNVFHSLRRSVHERMEEIAVLKAVGVPPRRIRLTFILQGLFIGVAGAAGGLAVGLLVAVNVNEVFAGVDLLVNAAVFAVRTLALSMNGASGGFEIFSPTAFYLTSVPSRVLPQEAFLVAFFAVGSCVAAAVAASRAVSRFRPAEVLRYE
ncbi:MAG TPA: FtsX-like permease family protein [Spirochaetia bacterium]|nr:FtsX-like permease family protein [Spirochaetia bacterium]